MSIKVQSYVWENSKAEGSALLLLLAIADHSHDDGEGAYPSVESLAAKCRQSERNTQYLIRKLEDMGELLVKDQAGPHGCNIYVIPVPWGANFAGVQTSVAGGANQRMKGVQPIAPEPSLTIINHNPPTASALLDGFSPKPNKTLEQAKSAEEEWDAMKSASAGDECSSPLAPELPEEKYLFQQLNVERAARTPTRPLFVRFKTTKQREKFRRCVDTFNGFTNSQVDEIIANGKYDIESVVNALDWRRRNVGATDSRSGAIPKQTGEIAPMTPRWVTT